MATTGGELGELIVQIIAETRDFDKGIDATEKKTKKFADNTKKISKELKQLIGGIGVAVLVKKIGQISAASISAASDAEEANAKFNTAFAGIESRAAAVAKELKNSYGLSQTESEKLLGSTGDLLKGFGATADGALDFSLEIQQLAVDLASYNNVQGGASRVSNILTKSVLGNKDGLSELGVSLLDVDIKQELVRTGQDKLTGQAGKLAKAQATYTLILQQTGDAQGDFARTQDSYANKAKVAAARTKDLQVELGRALLPAATKGVGIFSDLTGKLGEYIKGLNDVKVAEEAQKSGNATREQKLILLNDELDTNKKVLTGLENTAKTEEAQYGAASGFIKTQITELESLILQDERRVSGITKQIKAEQTLADANKVKADLQTEQDTKDEQAATNRDRNNKNLLKDINDINNASKTDIDIIDEKIAAIRAFDAKDEESRKAQLDSIRNLTQEKQAILDEEAKATDDKFLKELQSQQAFDAETRSIRDETAKLIEDQNKKELEDKKELQAAIINTIVSVSNSILKIANQQSNEEIRILEEKARKELEISKQTLKDDIDINNQKLQDAIDTNNEILQADLQLNADKLDLQLEAFKAETQTEIELRDFKQQLAEEQRAFDIEKTQEKIAELLATGEAQDAEEARRLEQKIINDEALRVLEDQAKLDAEQRITDITEAQRVAEEERLGILEDAKTEKERIDQETADANKTLLDAQAAEETRIKQDAAKKAYDIQLEQFKANQAIAALSAAINTAVAVTSFLYAPPVAIAVGIAGAAEIAAILTQPEPPKPAFATGGIATAATTATIGEAGGDVLLGMGAKGQPLFNEMIARLSDGINKNGGGGQTIININSLYPPSKQDLDRLAKDLYTGTIKEQQRRGIN